MLHNQLKGVFAKLILNVPPTVAVITGTTHKMALVMQLKIIQDVPHARKMI